MVGADHGPGGLGGAEVGTGAARELLGGVGTGAEDSGDLVERHGEQVVQDVGDSSARREPVEKDEQRSGDVLASQELLVGGQLFAGELRGGPEDLASALAAAQQIQAQPGGDRGEPAIGVVQVGLPRALDAQPRGLHQVLGVVM